MESMLIIARADMIVIGTEKFLILGDRFFESRDDIYSGQKSSNIKKLYDGILFKRNYRTYWIENPPEILLTLGVWQHNVLTLDDSGLIIFEIIVEKNVLI